MAAAWAEAALAQGDPEDGDFLARELEAFGLGIAGFSDEKWDEAIEIGEGVLMRLPEDESR